MTRRTVALPILAVAAALPAPATAAVPSWRGLYTAGSTQPELVAAAGKVRSFAPPGRAGSRCAPQPFRLGRGVAIRGGSFTVTVSRDARTERLRGRISADGTRFSGTWSQTYRTSRGTCRFPGRAFAVRLVSWRLRGSSPSGQAATLALAWDGRRRGTADVAGSGFRMTLACVQPAVTYEDGTVLRPERRWTQERTITELPPDTAVPAGSRRLSGTQRAGDLRFTVEGTLPAWERLVDRPVIGVTISYADGECSGTADLSLRAQPGGY